MSFSHFFWWLELSIQMASSPGELHVRASGLKALKLGINITWSLKCGLIFYLVRFFSELKKYKFYIGKVIYVCEMLLVNTDGLKWIFNPSSSSPLPLGKGILLCCKRESDGTHMWFMLLRGKDLVQTSSLHLTFIYRVYQKKLPTAWRKHNWESKRLKPNNMIPFCRPESSI